MAAHKGKPKPELMIQRRRVTTLNKAIDRLEELLRVKKEDLELTQARVTKLEQEAK